MIQRKKKINNNNNLNLMKIAIRPCRSLSPDNKSTSLAFPWSFVSLADIVAVICGLVCLAALSMDLQPVLNNVVF
jgi:hypothetical protein